MSTQKSAGSVWSRPLCYIWPLSATEWQPWCYYPGEIQVRNIMTLCDQRSISPRRTRLLTITDTHWLSGLWILQTAKTNSDQSTSFEYDETQKERGNKVILAWKSNNSFLAGLLNYWFISSCYRQMAPPSTIKRCYQQCLIFVSVPRVTQLTLKHRDMVYSRVSCTSDTII